MTHLYTSIIFCFLLSYFLFPSLVATILAEAEALELLLRCVDEMHTRFLINLPKFVCKIVDKVCVRLSVLRLSVARICFCFVWQLFWGLIDSNAL